MMRCTVAILVVMLSTPPIGNLTKPGVRPEIVSATERSRSADASERRAGLARLREAGEDARPAWPLLVDLLHEPNDSFDDRELVLRVLGSIVDPENEAMSQAIVQALLHHLVRDGTPNPFENYSLLCRHERQLRRAVPQLREMLHLLGTPENRERSVLVLNLLVRCGADGLDALIEAADKLWELANDPTQGIGPRGEAALAVACIDPSRAGEALSLLRRDSGIDRRRLVAKLAKFGPRARSAVPHLRELWTSTPHGTRHAAADALWRIDPDEAQRLGVVRPAPQLGEESRP